MKLPSKQELRRLWFKIHKWFGLMLAVPVVLIFLSGSVLVWKASVDDLLHPQRRVGVPVAQPPSFYVAATQRTLATGERIASLTYPRLTGAVVVTVMRPGAEASMEAWTRYYLHPVSGAVLDRASVEAGPLRIVHVLHGSLLLGRNGARLVGMIALALLLSAFSGLWLWWPMKGPFVRGLRWRRTQSTNANLHHQAGYWFAPPLVILALTGATISFPGSFNRLTGETAAARMEMARFVAPPLPQPRLSLPQALAAAGSPGQRDLESIAWPTVEDQRWKITLRDGHAVAIDDRNGRSSAASSQPETPARLMRRIHDGTGMPLAWQLIIFVSGLLGATMAVTGVIMWLKGQVREVRMKRQRAARTAR